MAWFYNNDTAWRALKHMFLSCRSIMVWVFFLILWGSIAGPVWAETGDREMRRSSSGLQPGWYSVSITYFQRKGTAALKLYRQLPAASEFTLVPADVYWYSQGD